MTVELPSGSDPAEIADLLIEAGGLGVEERDQTLLTYLLPPQDPDAAVARVRSLVTERAGVVLPLAAWSWQAQDDWAELWKRGLRSRRITDRIVVHPSWLAPEALRGDVVIELDPGMAFGTAEHGTTRGCLRLLDGLVVRGQSVLDVGTGSGILSICAALLGADRVLAVDLDPIACGVARKNAVRNGVQAVVEIEQCRVTPAWLAGLAPRDGLVANLETALLLPLLEGLTDAVRTGGWLVLSGILDSERHRIEAAVTELPHRLEIVIDDVDEAWWTVAFERQ